MSFINKHFLEKIFSGKTVIDFETKPAFLSAKNYSSDVNKTKVKFQEGGEITVFIKSLPTLYYVREEVLKFGLFEREIKMYGLLMEMKKIQEKFYGDQPFLSPLPLHCENNILVLEDVSECGYRGIGGRRQIDNNHCLTVLRQLARFHALSVKLNSLHPAMVEAVAANFYSAAHKSELMPFIESSFSLLARNSQTWFEKPEEVETFPEDFGVLGDCCFEKLLDILKPHPKGFNVLNHGDLWVNNMMFLYDEDGSTKHVKFVDFQLCFYGSPALDLLQFLFTSPHPDVLQDITQLITTYHTSLLEDLRTMEMNITYPLECLETELRQKAYYGVLMFTTILPTLFGPVDDQSDMAGISREELSFTCFESNDSRTMRDKDFVRVAKEYLYIMKKIGYWKHALANKK